MAQKKKKNDPSEIPQQEPPEIQPGIVPEDPIPKEEPEIIPEDEPEFPDEPSEIPAAQEKNNF